MSFLGLNQQHRFHECLNISPVIIQFRGLGNLGAVQRNAALTKDRMQKIINACCVISVSQLCSIFFYQFAFDTEFEVKVNVSISGHQEPVCLVDKSNWFVYCFSGLHNSCLSSFTTKKYRNRYPQTMVLRPWLISY